MKNQLKIQLILLIIFQFLVFQIQAQKTKAEKVEKTSTPKKTTTKVLSNNSNELTLVMKSMNDFNTFYTLVLDKNFEQITCQLNKGKISRSFSALNNTAKGREI